MAAEKAVNGLVNQMGIIATLEMQGCYENHTSYEIVTVKKYSATKLRAAVNFVTGVDWAMRY